MASSLNFMSNSAQLPSCVCERIPSVGFPISTPFIRTQTFINALRVQQPVEDGFSGALLPSSTFFYDRWAMSDRNSWFGFTASQEYAKATYSDYIKQRDEEWIAYLNEHAGVK